MQEQSDGYKDQHSQEQHIVEPTDVVAHPAAVMVELCAASVADGAMLASLDDVRLADVAIEQCIVRDVFLRSLVLILPSLLQFFHIGHRWISRVTFRYQHRSEHHSCEEK